MGFILLAFIPTLVFNLVFIPLRARTPPLVGQSRWTLAEALTILWSILFAPWLLFAIEVPSHFLGLQLGWFGSMIAIIIAPTALTTCLLGWVSKGSHPVIFWTAAAGIIACILLPIASHWGSMLVWNGAVWAGLNAWRSETTEHHRITNNLCVKCLYDLRGLHSLICPECGTQQPGKVWSFAREQTFPSLRSIQLTHQTRVNLLVVIGTILLTYLASFFLLEIRNSTPKIGLALAASTAISWLAFALVAKFFIRRRPDSPYTPPDTQPDIRTNTWTDTLVITATSGACWLALATLANALVFSTAVVQRVNWAPHIAAVFAANTTMALVFSDRDATTGLPIWRALPTYLATLAGTFAITFAITFHLLTRWMA